MKRPTLVVQLPPKGNYRIAARGPPNAVSGLAARRVDDARAALDLAYLLLSSQRTMGHWLQCEERLVNRVANLVQLYLKFVDELV